MKITFPHLGNTYFAAKALFDGLGVDYVIPPLSNKAALEVGSLYSPDEICLPFKIMIGNYIESIKKGADTVLFVGSCGPCRFGEYCELQMKLLKKLGHDLDFIVIDNPRDIGVKELLHRINSVLSVSNRSKKDQLKSIYYAVKIINQIDDIESTARYLAGYELNKGECKKLLNCCKTEALNINIPEQMFEHFKKYKHLLASVPIDKKKDPIKIAIVGEIYTIIEPFSSLYIEDKLMDYGISTKRHLTPSWWFKNMALTKFKINSLDIRKASKEYLPLYIGGHARECIGETILAKEQNFDGAIQIFPMGCMPEIVSKAILPSISKDKDFPILTLVVDELTGDAGYITRIEAFLDLLERRKKNVLYGS